MRLVLPDGWSAEPPERTLLIGGRTSSTLTLRVQPAPFSIRRARIAADVRIGRRHLGQHAEALVTIR